MCTLWRRNQQGSACPLMYVCDWLVQFFWRIASVYRGAETGLRRDRWTGLSPEEQQGSMEIFVHWRSVFLSGLVLTYASQLNVTGAVVTDSTLCGPAEGEQLKCGGGLEHSRYRESAFTCVRQKLWVADLNDLWIEVLWSLLRLDWADSTRSGVGTQDFHFPP